MGNSRLPKTTTQARALLAAGSSIALLAALAGCSSNAGDAAEANLPEKNMTTWVMPLDQYIPADTHAADYAENLLVSPCMTKAGFSWNVPWQDMKASSTTSLNTVGRSVFSEGLARQWGYHLAPSADSSLAAWKQFTQAHVDLSTAEESALTSCLKSARKDLPRLPGSAQIASGLGETAFQAALEEKTVKTAAAKWRSCMLPQGVSDLPDTPSKMPSNSVALEFGLNGDVSAAAPAVSDAERKLAIADAQCRDSSGYRTAVYDAEWSQQVKLLKDNADELGRVKAAIKKNKSAVDAVIASHASAQ